MLIYNKYILTCIFFCVCVCVCVCVRTKLAEVPVIASDKNNILKHMNENIFHQTFKNFLSAHTCFSLISGSFSFIQVWIKIMDKFKDLSNPNLSSMFTMFYLVMRHFINLSIYPRFFLNLFPGWIRHILFVSWIHLNFWVFGYLFYLIFVQMSSFWLILP